MEGYPWLLVFPARSSRSTSSATDTARSRCAVVERLRCSWLKLALFARQRHTVGIDALRSDTNASPRMPTSWFCPVAASLRRITVRFPRAYTAVVVGVGAALYASLQSALLGGTVIVYNDDFGYL